MWIVGASHNAGILLSWVENASSLIILAIAAGIIISSGQIDISSGSMVSLVGMIIIFLFNTRLGTSALSPGPQILISMIAGVVVYALMGLMVANLRVSSLLLTLSFSFLARGGSVVIQQLGRRAGATYQTVIPQGQIPGIFAHSWCWAIASIAVAAYWRFFTVSGLRHVAVGMSPRAAEFAGVKSRVVYLQAFILAGVLTVFSAVVSLFGVQQGGWAPDTGWGKELLAIAAAVTGGCRITGGRFEPVGIALACIVLVGAQDIVDGSGLPTEYAYVFFGAAIFLSMLLDGVGYRQPGLL